MNNLKEIDITICLDNSEISNEEYKRDMEMIRVLQAKKKLEIVKKSLLNNYKKPKSEEENKNNLEKKKLIDDEDNIKNEIVMNTFPIMSKKDENKEEKFNEKQIYEIEKIDKIPDDYYQRPSNLCKIITNFPGFEYIKKRASKKIDNIINNNIDTSTNKKSITEMYLNNEEVEKIKSQLSKSDLESYPKGEKDLLKYCPLEIPGLNLPKIMNIECNLNEGIELTKLYNIFKVKNNQNKFRRFILNISKDVDIYNIIIEKNYVSKIPSIKKVYSIDYYKSLNIPFYNFIQKPGETLIIEPGSIHISYIKNKNDDKNKDNLINAQIVYWSNSIYDNYKDLNCVLELNNEENLFPLTSTIIKMVNENLFHLSLSSIKNIQYYLQKILIEENKLLKDYINQKRFCKYYHENIISCYDCQKELINYYTFISKKKVICPKCFYNYSIEIIFYKYEEEDINTLLKRIGKAGSNIEKEDKSFIKNIQECFKMNCPNDIFNLNTKDISNNFHNNETDKSIDRFLMPLVDIDNITRVNLYDPLSSNYLNIGNDAFTELKIEKEQSIIMNNSALNNLSKLLGEDNRKLNGNGNENEIKKNHSTIQIPGKSIFDLFG